ncbi:MAG: ABC transporter ATP-binding protein [Mesorhizobium sp.]|nr:MAG: ABC transporter ATP-binding protein [Mesorhizobium sp.]
MTEPFLSIRHLRKTFGSFVAVHDVTIDIPKGEFLTFLGPSGSGKSTTLYAVAGFQQPTSGDVLLEGRSLLSVPSHKRNIGMVFQRYTLFQHLTVAENVAFPLRVRRRPDAEVNRKVAEMLSLVRLESFGGRYPGALSGGQQQRVALARALAYDPPILLMDEPLSALDKKLRTDMQIELQNLQREIGITFVLVTHDQEEALSMSDFVCVMNGGRIVQLGQPSEIYDEPADLFVADFVGKTNLLSGKVAGHSGNLVEVALADGTVIAARKRTSLRQDEAVAVSLRPESLSLGAPGSGRLNGIVRNRIFLGSTAEYAIEVGGIGTLLAKADHLIGSGNLFKPGEPVAIGFTSGTPLAFPDPKNNGTNQRENKHVEIIS